jgi:chorismate mutase
MAFLQGPAASLRAEGGQEGPFSRLDQAPAIRTPHTNEEKCMAVRAIRGATQVDADDREQVLEATRELVSAVLERNELTHDDVISILFTATPDLVSEFPALAARELGMGDVPLMCATEIDVPHALPRVLRLMAHVETPRHRSEIQHVYLRGATALRRDIAQ